MRAIKLFLLLLIFVGFSYNPAVAGDISIDKEKGVCISEVNCPNHLCEKMGWVNEVGVPVVCLPNNVYVIIASSSIDQDITLM